MQLKDIQEEKCSVCGAMVTAETRDRQHCNGSYNETRTFACGRRLHFIPNFMKVREVLPCPKSKEEVQKKDKRVKAAESMQQHLDSLDVDEAWKEAYASRVSYISV